MEVIGKIWAQGTIKGIDSLYRPYLSAPIYFAGKSLALIIDSLKISYNF